MRSKWLAWNVFEVTVRSNWLPTGGAFKATVHSVPLLGATGALKLASVPQGAQRSCSKHRCSATLSLVSLHSAALYTVHGFRLVYIYIYICTQVYYIILHNRSERLSLRDMLSPGARRMRIGYSGTIPPPPPSSPLRVPLLFR